MREATVGTLDSSITNWIKLLLAGAIVAGLALGFWTSRAQEVQAPQLNNETKQQYIPDILQTPEPVAPPQPARPTEPSGRHSTRGTITYQAAFKMLEGSPLQPYADQIASSSYGSTIIGICWIEQYHCQHAPSNNYWGIGGASGLKRYDSIPEGIEAIDALLAQYTATGHDTIEKLNGYYVYPASATWYNTVINIKTNVESLD